MGGSVVDFEPSGRSPVYRPSFPVRRTAWPGRIAAIRSWAYICQRPDWVLARGEMAARARAVEAKLSDALHGRLTERFVNRRTAILMKSLGQDPSMLAVTLADDGALWGNSNERVRPRG